MGFSQITREKALFLTNNASVEAALEWIQEHQDDADFEEELKIVGTEEKLTISQEEANQRALELQRRLKLEREKRDKELAQQQERDRVRSTKELNQVKVLQEEQEYKRGVEERIREKNLQQAEMKRMKELLRQDKETRFGKKFETEAEEAPAQGKTPQEKLAHSIKTVTSLYTPYRHPGVAKSCLGTLKAYTNNLLAHPEDERFRTIRKENKAFHDRVGKVTGGILYLKALGFEERGEVFVLPQPDPALLELGLALLEEALCTVS